MKRRKCRWKSLVWRGGKKGWVLTRKGWRKIEGRVVTFKETIGKNIVTKFKAKKVESLITLPWEASICFFIKIILQQPVCLMLQITKNLFKFPKHKKHRIWLLWSFVVVRKIGSFIYLQDGRLPLVSYFLYVLQG